MNIESDYYGKTYQVNISEKEISDNLEERVNRVSNIRYVQSVKEYYLRKLKYETLNIYQDKEKS